MQPQVQSQMIKLAESKAGPFSLAVADTLDEGKLVPAEIAKSIEVAGFVTEFTDGKTGAWCRVFLPFSAEERAAAKECATDEDCRYLRAQGFAPDRGSAFLHAVFGAVREEQAAAAVTEGLKAKAKELGMDEIKVDDQLRATLERRYILEGGDRRLAEDLKAFEKAK